MSPAVDTQNGATQAQEKPALSPLAQKVQKQLEKAAEGTSGYGTVPTGFHMNKDGECIVSFDGLDFVNGIGRSDSGKSEGCNLLLSGGELAVDVPGIGKVTYILEGRLPVRAKVKAAGR